MISLMAYGHLSLPTEEKRHCILSCSHFQFFKWGERNAFEALSS